MDKALKERTTNTIFKFEATLSNAKESDVAYTLDFERGVYRQQELVAIIRDTVPYFALTEDELKDKPLSSLYNSGFNRISTARRNYKGDYGELLLYIILSIFSDAPKFVTKARLRSNLGDQIKGFDCAHFTLEKDEVTLWLGEAKFHKSFSGAVSSAFASLSAHLNDAEKIKEELKILGGNIEINKSIEPDTYAKLDQYVNGGRSLDRITINVPVLITYDSDGINQFCGDSTASIKTEDFKSALALELDKNLESIYLKEWPSYENIKIIFYIVPLESVENMKLQLEQIETVYRL